MVDSSKYEVSRIKLLGLNLAAEVGRIKGFLA
jgi:hypothetical protein